MEIIQKGDVQALQELLSQSLSPNAKSEEGSTLLMNIIAPNWNPNKALLAENITSPKKEDINALVAVALGCGADVNEILNVGEIEPVPVSALYIAVVQDDIELVKILFAYGAKIQKPQEQDLLEIAMSNNNLAMLKLLALHGVDIAQANVLRVDFANDTDFALSSYLLDSGANINARYRSIGSVLAVYANDTRVLKFLISKGADVNVLGNDSRIFASALHAASYYGNVESLRLLIDSGADKTLQNKYQENALDVAQRQLERVQSVLDSLNTTQAKPTKSQKKPLTQAQRAQIQTQKEQIQAKFVADFGKEPAQAKQDYEAIIHILIESIAKDSRYELTDAIKQNDVQEIKRILEAIKLESSNPKSPKTYDINFRDNGYTSLAWATLDGNIEALKLLLEAGADTEVADYKCYTPLLIASNQSQDFDTYNAIIELLMDSGANIHAHSCDSYDSSYDTALTLAIKQHNTKAIEILLRTNAYSAQELEYALYSLPITSESLTTMKPLEEAFQNHPSERLFGYMLKSDTIKLKEIKKRIKQGADVHYKEPMLLNLVLAHKDIMPSKELYKILSFFIDSHAYLESSPLLRVKSKNINPFCALLAQDSASSLEFMRFLLTTSARENLYFVFDKESQSPIFCAINVGSSEALRLFIDSGANLYALKNINNKWHTPLSYLESLYEASYDDTKQKKLEEMRAILQSAISKDIHQRIQNAQAHLKSDI